VNVLLIGAGAMAVAYAKALRGQGTSFTVVGRGAQSAAAFLAATGVRPVEGGLSAYLETNVVAADMPVIVALPVAQLASATCELIAAGARKLLVEKPGGLDLAEIAMASAAARSHKAAVYVAYNRRFYASVAAAREMVAEDGGVTSFHMEFTELADRVATLGRDPKLLANWVLANSSHVVDLAFHLGGEAQYLSGEIAGALPWHPDGAVFAGHGRTVGGALFTWHANWGSAGRWGLDLRTRKRRLLLQPLEKLQVQQTGSLELSDVAIDDRLDREFKPGVIRQLQAFCSADSVSPLLPRIESHLDSVKAWLPCLRARREDTASRSMRVPV
jgi:predicted dehydrogenase